MTDVRCEDVMDLDFGNTVTSNDGKRYVFVGWTRNTVGKVTLFVECVDGMYLFHHANLRTYSCVFMETLERKFPGITEMYGK